MTSALLSLNILDFLPADQFLFELDPEPAADNAGFAPTVEVADASGTAGDETNDAPVELVSDSDVFVFEPLADIPAASAFGPDLNGTVSYQGPVAPPEIVGGQGAIASDVASETPSLLENVPDVGAPPILPETPAPTEASLSPDLEGYVGPGPAEPGPLNLDLAGYVPPAPPPEEPLFLDVLPGLEEADASAGLLFA